MAKPLIQYRNDHHWHAVYTRLFHEKKVESQLKEKQIEVFLPKKTIMKKWSDRKKLIEEPLIRPSIFVYVNQKEYYQVLRTPSVLHYVCFNGKAAIIPDSHISMLKTITENMIDCEITETRFSVCDKVMISSGPLKGCCGDIIRIDSLNYLVINILPNCFSVKMSLANTRIERIN